MGNYAEFIATIHTVCANRFSLSMNDLFFLNRPHPCVPALSHPLPLCPRIVLPSSPSLLAPHGSCRRSVITFLRDSLLSCTIPAAVFFSDPLRSPSFMQCRAGCYKRIGEQSFPNGDRFLSILGSFASLCNASGRIVSGLTVDRSERRGCRVYVVFFLFC